MSADPDARVRHVYVTYTSGIRHTYLIRTNHPSTQGGRFMGLTDSMMEYLTVKAPRRGSRAGSMLGQRLRRWPSIKPALGEHLTSNTHRDRDQGIQKQGRHITPGSNSNSLCSPHNYINVVVHCTQQTRDLNKSRVDVGPTSKMVGQHQPNIGSIYRVFRGEPNQVTIIPRKHRAGDIDG